MARAKLAGQGLLPGSRQILENEERLVPRDLCECCPGIALPPWQVQPCPSFGDPNNQQIASSLFYPETLELGSLIHASGYLGLGFRV